MGGDGGVSAAAGAAGRCGGRGGGRLYTDAGIEVPAKMTGPMAAASPTCRRSSPNRRSAERGSPSSVRRRSWWEADGGSTSPACSAPRIQGAGLDSERARFGVSWPGDGDEAAGQGRFGVSWPGDGDEGCAALLRPSQLR